MNGDAYFDRMELVANMQEALNRGYAKGYADAKAKYERPHGEWVWKLDEETGESGWNCPVCNEFGDSKSPYCPNCGADMRTKKSPCDTCETDYEKEGCCCKEFAEYKGWLKEGDEN